MTEALRSGGRRGLRPAPLELLALALLAAAAALAGQGLWAAVLVGLAWLVFAALWPAFGGSLSADEQALRLSNAWVERSVAWSAVERVRVVGDRWSGRALRIDGPVVVRNKWNGNCTTHKVMLVPDRYTVAIDDLAVEAQRRVNESAAGRPDPTP